MQKFNVVSVNSHPPTLPPTGGFAPWIPAWGSTLDPVVAQDFGATFVCGPTL